MMDGMLATLVNVQDDDGYFYCAIETFDLASGKSRQYPIEGLCGACRGTQGELICLLIDESEMNYSLCRINVLTGETSDIDIPINIETTVEDSLGGLAYHEATNAIYLCANSRVYRSLNGGAFEAFALVPTQYVSGNTRGWTLPDECYAMLSNGMHIRAESQETANELVYVGWTGGLEKYAVDHPEIVLTMHEWLYGNELAEALMKQDDSVDIYITYADYTFENIKRQGYAASLSSSKLIKNDVSQLYPEIQSVICDENGDIVAYPGEIDYWVTKVNLNYWHKFWPDRPEPTTFDEVLDAWIDWEENLADEYPGMSFYVYSFEYDYLVQAFVQTYARQHDDDEFLDLDTPELRSVLEKLKQVRDIRLKNGRNCDGKPDSSVSDEEVGGSGGSIFYLTVANAMWGSNVELQPTSEDYLYGELKSHLTVMPLTFEKDAPKYTEGRMTVYILNPYAKHKAAAMQFFEELVQDKSLSTYMGDRTYYAIHPNDNEPLEDPTYEENRAFREMRRDEYKEALEKARANGEDTEVLESDYQYYVDWLANEDNRYVVSERIIREYRNMIEQYPLNFSEKSPYIGSNYNGVSDAVAVLESACERYAAGNLTLDAFLQEVTSKVKMIYAENQ